MRKILILSLGFALSLGAQAKDYHRTADTTTVVCRLSADGMLRPLKPSYMKGALVASPWTDNWFVQAAGGTTVFLGKPLGCNDLFGRMKPAFSVSIGKWFTPSVGTMAVCSSTTATTPRRTTSTCVLISCGMSSATSTRTMYTLLPDGVSFHTWAWVCCTTR